MGGPAPMVVQTRAGGDDDDDDDDHDDDDDNDSDMLTRCGPSAPSSTRREV